MKSYGGGSFFSIKRQDVLETTEQLSQERRYPVLKIDHHHQNFTLLQNSSFEKSKNKKFGKTKNGKRKSNSTTFRRSN